MRVNRNKAIGIICQIFLFNRKGVRIRGRMSFSIYLMKVWLVGLSRMSGTLPLGWLSPGWLRRRQGLIK